MSKRIDRIPKRFRSQVERQLKTLSQLIQEQRQALGLTQERMAETLDVSVESIKLIESGRGRPSLPMLFHICAVLKIEVEFKV